MARLKGWKGPGKSRTLKSATVTYISRGALVASSWPKKRGRPKSPITRDQNEWFRQANQLAKYADGQAQWMAIELSKDSPWYPRDILISAMAGRLFETLNLDGVEFRSVAIRDDVSSDLDFLAGKVKGTIMVRGEDLWSALVPGPLGNVLTSNGPDTLPTYDPSGSGSGLSLASNVPVNSFSNAGYAAKGNQFRVLSAYTIHTLATRINATINHVYRGYVFQLGAPWKLVVLKGETADIVAPSTGFLNVEADLLNPALMTPGDDHCIMWSRRDGPNNFALPIASANTTMPILGMPIIYFFPSNGINPRIRLQRAQPAVDDIVTPFNTGGHYISAQIEL